MPDSDPPQAITRPRDLQREIEKDRLIQEAIISILRISLEAIPLEELLHRILNLVIKLEWLPFQHRGCIFLVDESSNELVMKTQIDMPEVVQAACARVPFGKCLCGRAILQKKIMFKDCMDEHHCIRYPGITPHGHYCIPLATGTRQIGLLNLYVEEGHEPSPVEGQFLRAVADVLAGVVERSRAEDSLRKSEERFDLAIQGTDAGIWDWDLRTNTVSYSSHWKDLLGYEEDEIDDQPAWETRLHPEDRARSLATLRAYLEGVTSHYELEYRLRHKDGSYRWFLVRGAMVRDREGRPYRMVGSELDITERKRVDEELRQRLASLTAARKILERLLPHAPLHTPGCVVHGACFAADYAQGDLFDYFLMGDGSIVAGVADVCGHGIDAALLMASMQARFRTLAELSLGMDEILGSINAALLQQSEDLHFITGLFLRIDPWTRTMVYANAGHPPGLVLSKNGELKSSLDSLSLPLGIEADAEFPIGGPFALEPGDLVLLFTDGVFEARSPEGILFGIERVLQVVRGRIDLPNEEILKTIHEAVCKFTGSRQLADDATVVLVRLT